MSEVIYVMLINGRPRRKDGGAIRTYKTRERAEKEARELATYWSYRAVTFQVGVFTTEQLTEVTVELPVIPPIPYAPPTEAIAE
ncbi:hypothetical protein BSK66_07870 [Paenibacillus odorifer]|uniref:Uncharacterized protein n=1 Tax=Paenibacillus odorifer TaxID=189426 RepID=A0A1R0X300_9BACL|nr:MULTISPECIES: hypothetical protein [Paenibacillus]ETT64920.1 hypothetical protein C171_07887 [Paenibacillus sp. FSL H8-237]OMD27476.1 hypothetical protein BJP51_25100 [Paenibacillus odorifer]OME61038.1 hypothetical protein BSK66_07870 [Paenibacillus odorifer]